MDRVEAMEEESAWSAEIGMVSGQDGQGYLPDVQVSAGAMNRDLDVMNANCRETAIRLSSGV